MVYIIDTMTSGKNIETEYLELTAKNGWPVAFQQIKSKGVKETGTLSEAIKPQNKVLNRYRDVNPYDHSRIKLQRGSTDYINANLIKVEKANRQYILTQGPLPHTVSHFWLMAWEQGTKAIIMLNKLVEKKLEKCSQYWPTEVGDVMTLSDVGLSVEYLEQQDHSYFLARILKLTDTETGKSRDIYQFHYITWPDFGVPSSPTAFIEFLRRVRRVGGLEPTVGPPIVHCSAGIGRSGTFCLVDSCLFLIEKFGLNSVDAKEILVEMRKYRMGLIQTPEQLRFSYQAIIEGAKHLLNQNNVEPEEIITEYQDASESEDDDEPPPLPPPRIESLKSQNGTSFDRPLPNIPKSVSNDDLNYENNDINKLYIPNAPLAVVPSGESEHSEEDEVEVQSESSVSEKSDLTNSVERLSPSELRHRKRAERKETMEAQVRDMKRRQQINEQWTQLKRSLYIPLVIGGSMLLGGGLLAYYYFKS